jgi:hypothetical protein
MNPEPQDAQPPLIYLNNAATTIRNIMALPIALQEMVTAVWLIVKGFNPSVIASGSATRE